jgi:hypothetical protein
MMNLYNNEGYDEYAAIGVVRLSYINIPFLYTYLCNCGVYGEVG